MDIEASSQPGLGSLKTPVSDQRGTGAGTAGLDLPAEMDDDAQARMERPAAPAAMRLRDALTIARASLTSSASPDLDAEILLADLLGLSRAQLLSRDTDVLDAENAKSFFELVQRRGLGEPIAYILGRAYFHAIELLSDKRALIPRPETEFLVDWSLDWLRERSKSSGLESGPKSGSGSGSGLGSGPGTGLESEFESGHSAGTASFADPAHALETTDSSPEMLHIVDIGTGSGAIILALAKAIKDAGSMVFGCELRLHATDLSIDALDLARSNALHLGLQDEVEFIEADLLDRGKSSGTSELSGLLDCDLIVANLPYIGTEDRSRVQDSVHRYEPHIALYAGTDGFEEIQRLLEQLHEIEVECPKVNRGLALEVGDRQALRVQSMLLEYFPAAKTLVKKDLAGIERYVLASPLGLAKGSPAR